METKDILIFIAGIIASLVINYLTQYTSTPLANKFNKWRDQQAQMQASKSLKKAKKRYQKMLYEVSIIKHFVEEPIAFNALAARILQRLILRIGFLIFAGISTVMYFDPNKVETYFMLMMFVLIYFTTGKEDREMGVSEIFKKISYYEDYVKKLKGQMDELEKVVDEFERVYSQ